MDTVSAERAPRLRLQQFLPVHDQQSQQLLGRVVDLSLSGLMLIAPQEVPIAQTFALEIKSPADLHIPALHIQAESVWCRNNPNNPAHFGVGFRFQTMTESQQALLQRILQQPGIVH